MTGEWMSMVVSLGATLHPAFRAAWKRPGRVIPGRARIFQRRRAPPPRSDAVRAAGTASGGRRGQAPRPLGRSCQEESAAVVHLTSVPLSRAALTEGANAARLDGRRANRPSLTAPGGGGSLAA